MDSQNFFSDNEDILFHLENRCNWGEIFSLLSKEEKEVLEVGSVQEYKEAWMTVLESLGEICGGPIQHNSESVDRSKIKFENGVEVFPDKLRENIDLLLEFGLASSSVHPKFGGMGATFLVDMIGCELMNRACPSTNLNMGWYGPIARVIEAFGSKELQEEYVPRICSGEISGNMALTEPDAGSDLAALRTYAEKNEDGSYRLYGTKRFISNGTSHVSLVLAKNKKGVHGLEHLSLFLCPRIYNEKENIKVLKLEEKIGLRASATCELAYDGSKAWLLGKEGDGFSYMLQLMNDSRIAVGFQGVGLMEATFALANKYAHERKTWGQEIAKHELIAEILLDLEVEQKALRSICYQAAYERSLYFLIENRLKDNGLSGKEKVRMTRLKKISDRKVRRWTPLLKYWVGEKSVIHARQAMQILGGYGFTTEYKAEWWLRESLIYSLYEGTSQIQALMCIKDVLKEVLSNPKTFIEDLFGLNIKAFAEIDPLQRKLNKIKKISQNAVLSVLFKLVKQNFGKIEKKKDEKNILLMLKKLSAQLVNFDNLSPALLHAERICQIKCIEAMAECLLEDAKADSSREWIAERFMNKNLPDVARLKTLIDQDDPVILRRLAEFKA